MRLRNNLLALAILAVFLAFGTLYVRFWVVQRPFGIIVFVSDGFVTRHLTAARLYADGADYRLHVERDFPHAALVRNDSSQFAVSDSASMASAIATGRRTRHHTVGVDEDGRMLASILELARKEGRKVGLVTNGRLTDPSSAAFYAHTSNAEDPDAMAAALLKAESFSVLFGGGMDDFLPSGKGGRRKDGQDLLAGLQAPRWEIVRTKAGMENAQTYRKGTLLGLFADGRLAYSKDREAGLSQPSLTDLVRRAIQILETNRNGYVLVVDEALVARAAVVNEGEHLLRETLELDRAVDAAVEYSGDRSLILAIGRGSVGGFSLSGYPLRRDRGLAILGPTPEGLPSITWATGPGSPDSNEPATVPGPAGLNTAEDVIALGRGLGAEKIQGFMDATDIFQILRNGL